MYASVSRFRIDDLAPYIYRTHDSGKTWTLITTGLPPGPVDAVREDPVRKGLLYAATENAVWVSFDDGDSWQSLQRNLPHTAARDIVVHDRDLIVATHGRGFWIMDDITPLRQAAAAMADTLWKPGPAIRIPRSLNTDTPIPPDEPMAENPPTGAVIDYYLAEAVSGPVTLEISDAHGKLVRRFASTDPPDPSPEELARQLIPAYWVRPHQALGTAAGGHRWVWDLRGERPLAQQYDYPISAVPHDTPRGPQGPTVPPGSYTVKLTAGGKTLTAPLEVKLDPRIKLSPAAIAQQYQRAVRLAELLTRSTQAVRQARSAAAQLGKLNASDPLKAQVTAAAGKVALLLSGPRGATPAERDRLSTLMGVNGKLATLYRIVDVDAVPTAAVIAELTKAERELAQLTTSWDTLKAELATLSTALTGAGLPAIQPEAPPPARDAEPREE
ncbi:MAG: hypothetical protein E6J91_25585 [Deltaproteobacteria bacterium]|nr:MAG: hypothetical protein E6J91_25585 [Deltaproteobacteria bacterium]